MRKFGLVLVFVFFVSFASAVTFTDQGSGASYLNGTVIEEGNLTFLIYENATGGSPIFNHTYVDKIVNGTWNVVVSGVDLDFGSVYYKDYEINGDDLDFDGN
ncbi:MAG: hypothetical protein MI922_08115, partial [Bacteroidales bacterium]|nr:hypothetical protein [Bacteroidales bacterium]